MIDAAANAAMQLGLLRSWLSENVAMYARRGERDADRISLGLYPSPERFGLRVTAAKPSYILAMKLKAPERTTIDDRDYEGSVNLGIERGVHSVDELREFSGQFFPDEDLPPRVALRLEELASNIGAKLGFCNGPGSVNPFLRLQGHPFAGVVLLYGVTRWPPPDGV